MRFMLDRKSLLCGLVIVAASAACVPGIVTTASESACALCTIAGYKEGIPASAKAVTASPRGVDVVALAADLAEQGYSTNSPLSLLTAAELLMQASPTALAGKQGTSMPAVPAKSGATVRFDPGAMIAAARSMAGDNTSVTALASQLQNRLASGPKGAVGGPQSATDLVLAHSTDTWRVDFRGGELGSIRVNGDRDTDLDCYVYNSAGTLLAYDNDLTDYCILDWYQASTGTVRLEIRNLGDVYNRYIITTN